MTKSENPFICDFHGGKIETEEHYSVSITRSSKIRGEFEKSVPQADLCAECYAKMLSHGYSPMWLLMKQNQDGKWEEHPIESKTD